MTSLRAHVANGRLVLDEPTDLPEGTEVVLVPVADLDADELDAEDRARLHAALLASEEELDEDRLVAAGDLIAELRDSSR